MKENDYPDLSKMLNNKDELYPDLSKPIKNKKERSFLSKLPANILSGLAQMGHGLINSPHNIANVFNTELANKIPKQQEYNYPELLGLPKESTLSDKLIRGAAQYAPAMMLPAAEMGIAGEAASMLPRMMAQAAPQAAFGATQNENPIHGALEGAAGGAGGELISTMLRPSKLFRGNLSDKDLQKNLEETEGTTTGLGRILDLPSLTRFYENILPHVIGSGAENQMQKTGKQVIAQGENLLEKVKGKFNPEDIGVQLQEALKKASSEARTEKNEGFKRLNKMADDSGLKIGRENFQNKARELIEEIKQSPELTAEVTPSLLKDLERYSNNPEGNNLKLTNIFRGKLGDKANDLYEQGNMHEFGLISSLKDSLSTDIESSLEKHGNKELKEAYENNQKDYMEKYAPFEDKDIVKFTRQGGDPDLILPYFFRGGKNDRATLLSKLTSKVQSKQSDIPSIVTYAHFSKAIDKDGRIDPLKLASLYRNLGEKQKNALFNDNKTKKEFENFVGLVNKNKESFDLMRNPKTGSRNSDLLIKLSQVIGGSTAGGLPGFLATTIGSGLAGKTATHLLTNEKIRTNLIKKMLEKGNNKNNALIPGLLNMELNQYKGVQSEGDE